MAMISPETQTSRLWRKTAHLLRSFAEAASAAGAALPGRWDLHRIGTEAYLAQHHILHMLGQGEVPTEPLSGVDIAGALEEAAQTLAVIPQECHPLDTERVEQRLNRRPFDFRGMVLVHVLGLELFVPTSRAQEVGTACPRRPIPCDCERHGSCNSSAERGR